MRCPSKNRPFISPALLKEFAKLLFGRCAISGKCIFWGSKSSKIKTLLRFNNACPPWSFFTCATIKPNPAIPRFVICPDFSVCHVFTMSADAQIASDIVESIAVNVVNTHIHRAIHDQSVQIFAAQIANVHRVIRALKCRPRLSAELFVSIVINNRNFSLVSYLQNHSDSFQFFSNDLATLEKNALRGMRTRARDARADGRRLCIGVDKRDDKQDCCYAH